MITLSNLVVNFMQMSLGTDVSYRKGDKIVSTQ
jgi:hypothetical protein